MSDVPSSPRLAGNRRNGWPETIGMAGRKLSESAARNPRGVVQVSKVIDDRSAGIFQDTVHICIPCASIAVNCGQFDERYPI